MKKIILFFLSWRLFLLIPLVASHYFLLPRIGYFYANLTYFLEKGSALSNFLLYPFGNFDAAYYLLIAAQGYTVNAGFFPLFPLSLHLASWPFGKLISELPFTFGQYVVAITLVTLFFLLSLLVFRKLIKLDYKEDIAISSIIFLLIFPTSFFFAAIYSEGLFLLLSLLSFYFARKNKWFLAGIMGALLSATRFVGVAILPSLLYEYFKYEKKKSLKKIASILLTPLGLIFYMIYNAVKWGNPFYFIQAQGNFQNNRTVDSVVLFPQTIYRYFKILFGVAPNIYEWWVSLFELLFFSFGLVMLYIGWRKKIRISYLIFGLLCLLIPASTGTLSGILRYMLIIFPIFITLSLIKNKTFKIVYSGISIALLFIFFMLFSKGYFIS